MDSYAIETTNALHPLDSYVRTNLTNNAGWYLCGQQLARELRRRIRDGDIDYGLDAMRLLMSPETARALDPTITDPPEGRLVIYLNRLDVGERRLSFAVMLGLPDATIYAVPSKYSLTALDIDRLTETVPERRIVRFYNYNITDSGLPDVCNDYVWEDDE